MSDLKVQGRFGVHTGYASVVELQRLRVSRSAERGCCGLES